MSSHLPKQCDMNSPQINRERSWRTRLCACYLHGLIHRRFLNLAKSEFHTTASGSLNLADIGNALQDVHNFGHILRGDVYQGETDFIDVGILGLRAGVEGYSS